jgi:hypothetical protein
MVYNLLEKNAVWDNMIDVAPFIQLGKDRLAPYLTGVPVFIDKLGAKGGLKKTKLRAKPPETYIRNMLAVGVLSRIMRPAFRETDRRVIVLPECLKKYGEETCCKADLGGGLYTCGQCNSDCIVFESVERFVDSRTTLVLEPDDMDVYFADLHKSYGAVGIVGVACALTMLSGFQRTLKHKHPTQGVFLNYASCGHHWAKPGYNTSYSLKRMAWVLNGSGSDIPDDIRGRGETYSMEKSDLSPDDFYRHLDNLSELFMEDYYPQLRIGSPDLDLYALCEKIRDLLVPDLITRDSV